MRTLVLGSAAVLALGALVAIGGCPAETDAEAPPAGTGVATGDVDPTAALGCAAPDCEGCLTIAGCHWNGECTRTCDEDRGYCYGPEGIPACPDPACPPAPDCASCLEIPGCNWTDESCFGHCLEAAMCVGPGSPTPGACPSGDATGGGGTSGGSTGAGSSESGSTSIDSTGTGSDGDTAGD